jgi:glycosyltransferase involved in cell wall biosynthesis
VANGGIGRLKNMVSFERTIKKHRARIAKLFGKPDVVNGCSVHPFAWVAGYKAAKRYKARFCVEVRDLWPAIWVLNGEKSKNHPMVLFFGALEKWAYRKADRIIYSMVYGDRYICDELGFSKEKAFLIGQPMDCERFDENAETKKSLIPEDIRSFIKDSFVCVFAGYYMTYEGVYTMLEAAKVLKEKGLPIKMIFVGSGQEKEGMESYAKQNNLDNVYIGSRISKEAIPGLLKASKICMAHLAIEGREKAYQYGVSKNKVNEYLYSGACTIYGFIYKDDVVASSGAGYVIEPYNSVELAERIEEVYHMQESESSQFGVNGRKYINDNHRVEVLADKLEHVFLG